MGLDVRGVISFLIQKGGLVEAQTELQKLSGAGDRAATSIERISGQFSSLRNALIGGAISAFVQSSVLEFAKVERAIGGLGARLNTIDQGGALKSVVADLQAIQDGGGSMLTETIPIFTKFVGITQDVSSAMYATRLASDIAESGFIDTASAADALQNLLQGKVKGAAQALGIAIRDSNGEEKTRAQLIEETVSLFDKLSEKLTDTQDGLDRASAAWSNIKRTIGEAASTIVAYLAPALEVTNAGLKKFIELSTISRDVIWSRLNIGEAVVNGWQSYADAIGRADQALVDLAKSDAAKSRAWWQGPIGPPMPDGLAEQNALSERKKLIEIANRQAEAEERDQRQKQAERDAKAAAQRAAAEKDARLKAIADLAQAEADALDKGSRERLEADQRVLDARRAIELNAQNLTEEARLAIIRRYGIESLRINQEFIDEQVQQEEKAAEKRAEFAVEQQERIARLTIEAADSVAEQYELETYYLMEKHAREYEEAEKHGYDLVALKERQQLEIEDIERSASDARKKIAAAEEEQKRQQWINSTNMALDALGVLFGNSKAFAMAKTVIDTQMAVANALATVPYPANFVVAGLVLAAGIKALKTISETDYSKGKGFDDPRNDRMAYLGGQRWASDMIRNISEGFRDGLAQQTYAGSSSATSYDQRTTIVFQGPVYAGNREMRQLEMDLRRAARRNATRSLR